MQIDEMRRKVNVNSAKVWVVANMVFLGIVWRMDGSMAMNLSMEETSGRDVSEY